MDGGAGGDELGAHGHEEGVEDVDWLGALDRDQAAVEAASELDLVDLRPRLSTH